MILITKGQQKEIHGALTDVCKLHKLPYRVLNLKKFPFKWKAWKFEKIEYKKQYINK